MSPSAKKVWIEIHIASVMTCPVCVTFCKEGVDWNRIALATFPDLEVTFCKEGVDWNHWCRCQIWNRFGHLLQRRCGLKLSTTEWNTGQWKSPSAKKVWIEISLTLYRSHVWVASPSAKKVWIEIWFPPHNCCLNTRHLLQRRCGLKWQQCGRKYPGNWVTFCKEGVDWNTCLKMMSETMASHLLQRRCGLK